MARVHPCETCQIIVQTYSLSRTPPQHGQKYLSQSVFHTQSISVMGGTARHSGEVRRWSMYLLQPGQCLSHQVVEKGKKGVQQLYCLLLQRCFWNSTLLFPQLFSNFTQHFKYAQSLSSQKKKISIFEPEFKIFSASFLYLHS